MVVLFPSRFDNATFLYIGEMWAKGIVPYVQLFDNKPPGIFGIVALAARTPHTMSALCVLEFVFVLAAILTVRKILQRCGASDGTVLLGTLATALMVNLASYVPGSNPETFMLWPMTASMLLFVMALQSSKVRYVFLAGACSGIACMFKPFGLSVMFAQLAFSLFCGNKRLSSIAANVAGAFAVWIPVLVYFALHHGLREMLDASFFYNVHYGLTSQPTLHDLLRILVKRLGPVSTALLCLGFGLTRFRRTGNQVWTLTLLWFGAGLLLVLAAGRGYGHYFLSLAPALGLAVGLFFWSLEGIRDRIRLGYGALILSPILVVYIFGAVTAGMYVRTIRRQGVAVNDAVAMLRHLAKPSSTLLVWGYEPSLFSATHLRSALRYPTTQYIYDSPLSYSEVGTVVLNGMSAASPDYVVVTPWDFQMKWAHKSDTVHAAFLADLQRSYVEVWTKDSYSIYRRDY
jgi:hypothetical protein